MNNSISVTLEEFYTETKVTFNDQLTQDQFWLNGEKVSGKELEKISKYMDIVRNRAGIDWYVKRQFCTNSSRIGFISKRICSFSSSL